MFRRLLEESIIKENRGPLGGMKYSAGLNVFEFFNTDQDIDVTRHRAHSDIRTFTAFVSIHFSIKIAAA